ncbi:MAG: hypothetical protein HONBIEJF_01696 [Fimbriimonadaceae bacterium]|nr:hypothetical protein [Fimbriimonadaceae bacterium]
MTARGGPIATLILIALNIAVAFAIQWEPSLIDRLGFRPNAPSLRDAVSSIFMHANIIHLGGNMIFLAAVGPAVESLSGSVRLVALYLVGGLIGLLMHSLFIRHGIVIGASGCVAAAVAYYCAAYPNMRVPLAPRLQVPIWSVAAIWIGLQALGAIVRLGDSGGTAFWTHVGGFSAGILLSILFKAPAEAQRRHGHIVLSALSEKSPEARIHAAKEHLAKFPNDLKAWAELAEAYRDATDETNEIVVRLRLIESLPESQQVPHLERLDELEALAELPSLRRSMLADRFGTSKPDLAIRLLESIVSQRDDVQRPDAVLALATAVRESDQSRFEALMTILERSYPLHAATEVARTKGWLA